MWLDYIQLEHRARNCEHYS